MKGFLAAGGGDVGGRVEPGFEPVRDTFLRNFAQHREHGAACAAYHEGKKVVDLWAGLRDRRRGRPFVEDTLIAFFGAAQGVAAMALALAHSRGLLDYEEWVDTYWPEFAQDGKQKISLRQLLGHRAGLPALKYPPDLHSLTEAEAAPAAILARQKPEWRPGTRQGYHYATLGWIEDELIRRVDPAGRSLERFLLEEVLEPLGLEFYFDLPESVPPARLAVAEEAEASQLLTERELPPLRLLLAHFTPGSATRRALDGSRKTGGNSPSAQGFGLVRSVARLYSMFTECDRELKLIPETLYELEEPDEPRWDKVLKQPVSWSLGFAKPSPRFDFGGSRAFGMPALGGALGFADPDRRLGFAYAPTRLGFRVLEDRRAAALRHATQGCIDRL